MMRKNPFVGMARAAMLAVAFVVVLASAQGPVSYYGKLQATGNKLTGSKTGANKPVQVRGISLGWSNSTWESSRFFETNVVDAMVDDWKAEVIRAPLGIENNGYFNPASTATNPSAQAAANKERVLRVVDAAIARDVYIIIDWHSHTASGNTTERQLAKEFFAEMAQTYGDKDHVIFEIYNEPTTGTSNTWANIKSYAEEVIAEIRKHSNNLVLVGTRQWCQRIDEVAVDGAAIDDINVAYVFHFYAHTQPRSMALVQTPRKTFEDGVLEVLNKGLPVFLSEWGTTHNDGGQPNATGGSNFDTHNAVNSDAWMAFCDEHKISSAAWNMNHKHEGSAFFKAPTQGGHAWNATSNPVSGWPATHFTDQDAMTESGKYIFNLLNRYAEDAEWRNGSNTTTYTLTYIAGDNGKVGSCAVNDETNLPDTLVERIELTAEQGSNVLAACAYPNSGYVFKEWSDGRTDYNRMERDVQSDITVTAIFEVEDVSVKHRVRAGSVGSPLVLRGRTLTINPQSQGAAVSVRVINMSGKTVSRFTANGKHSVSLSKLPVGRYIAEFRENGKRHTLPFVLK